MDYLRLTWRNLLCAVLLLFLGTSPSGGLENPGTVGVQVVPVATGEIVVLQVVNGSPADKGGLLPGDLIVAVDGRPLRGTDFEEVMRTSLWGETGSSVSLEWKRPGTPGIRTTVLTRTTIDTTQSPTPAPGVRIMTPE